MCSARGAHAQTTVWRAASTIMAPVLALAFVLPLAHSLALALAVAAAPAPAVSAIVLPCSWTYAAPNSHGVVGASWNLTAAFGGARE